MRIQIWIQAFLCSECIKPDPGVGPVDSIRNPDLEPESNTVQTTIQEKTMKFYVEKLDDLSGRLLLELGSPLWRRKKYGTVHYTESGCLALSFTVGGLVSEIPIRSPPPPCYAFEP